MPDPMLDDLPAILSRVPPPIAETTRRLVDMLRRERPDLEARVKPGWGSVNFRHRRAGFVCAVFPAPDHVALVFEHGRLLDSPLLEGNGRQVRFIRLVPGMAIPVDDIAILLAEAIALRA